MHSRRMSIRSLIPAVVAVLLIGLVTGACGVGAGGSPAPAAVKVVTTTTVFADIVRNVGGDRVTVESIIPTGVGPEDFEPDPEDARKLADADLIVSNGVGLDDFLDDLIETAGEGAVPRLVLGDGIPSIEVDGEQNPHFWLDPTLVTEYYLPAIESSLASVDPDGTEAYAADRADYAATLETMDASNRAAIEAIPPSERKLVTAHDAFPYFARHYGFELIGVILENVGQEPSVGELAALVETVKAADVKAIFSESQFSPQLSETLATEAGIRNVVTTLYNDSLGPAPADTYVGMMEWNVGQIVDALRPG